MNGPDLRFDAKETERDGVGWRTRWRVTNAGGGAVRLESIAAPHSRYRAPEEHLNVDFTETMSFELTATVNGGPRDEIENAFLLIVARVGDERWRVLARFRVRFDEDGTPRPSVESVTAHRVGFSGEV